MTHPPSAVVALKISECEADKIGLGDRWRTAWKKIVTGNERKAAFEGRLRAAVNGLLKYAVAQNPPWSQRRLASKVGISWIGWRRCREGKVNARRWFPRLEAALARLTGATLVLLAVLSGFFPLNSQIENRRVTRKLNMLIDLSNPSPLVDVNFVRVCRRINADEVFRLADYELVWCWDVSIDSRNGARELRFWINCVVCPQMTARQTLDGVLCQLLPQSRQTLHGSEVGQLLLVSRDSVARLARILKTPLVNRTWHFKREVLFAWLKSRYIGGMP